MKKQDRGPAALVIDRSKWFRGGGAGSVLLSENDGRMCCLGFFGLACGARADQLCANARPDVEDASTVGWPKWLLKRGDEEECTPEAWRLMGANDSPLLSEAEREARIAAIFAKHGVAVTFVDGPPPDSLAAPKEEGT